MSFIIDDNVLKQLQTLKNLKEQGVRVGRADLHALSRFFGADCLAKSLDLNVRTLRSYMSGERRIPVEVLAALAYLYPEFDIRGTVMRLGRKRANKGVSVLSDGWIANNEDFLEEE